jgi:hypothetical protein
MIRGFSFAHQTPAPLPSTIDASRRCGPFIGLVGMGHFARFASKRDSARRKRAPHEHEVWQCLFLRPLLKTQNRLCAAASGVGRVGMAFAIASI